MARYEGLVTKKKNSELVEVIIVPSSKGIPGASETINQQVCHCAADGSQVPTEAINTIGAEVGDWVVIHRDSSALWRNALVIIGIPLLGLIVGLTITYSLTNGFASFSTRALMAGGAPLVASVVFVLFAFDRLYKPSTPIVASILTKASDLNHPQVCPTDADADICKSCRITC